MRNTLDFWGLEFERRPVAAVSSAGTPFSRWVPFGMPRVPDRYLDCVFYLYRTEEDARIGRSSGGTGFIVSVPSEAAPGDVYLYAVTNWHVAVSDGFSVVRIMLNDGTPDIFAFEPHEWTFDPNGHDLAIIHVPLDTARHAVSFVPRHLLVSEDRAKEISLGIGEDVFMIGRFVDHDGGEINKPTVRFGHISLMPSPIAQGPHDYKRDSFCLDMHSRSGYSGSPVFVYRSGAWDLAAGLNPELAGHVLTRATYLLSCLGIHFSQFPELWKIKPQKKPSLLKREVELEAGEHHIEGVSGMTCVVPAWAITSLLDTPRLKEGRDVNEANLAEKAPKLPANPVPESAAPERPPIAGDEQHKERFTALLDAAVGRPKQAG